MGNRFSFHEFYNFLLFSFVITIIFLKTVFFPTTITHTHTHDPHPRPTPTTHTHDSRPLPTTHDPRHLATLQINVQGKCAARAKFFFFFWLIRPIIVFSPFSLPSPLIALLDVIFSLSKLKILSRASLLAQAKSIFYSKTMHLQKLRGTQCSKLSICKGYHYSIEGI